MSTPSHTTLHRRKTRKLARINTAIATMHTLTSPSTPISTLLYCLTTPLPSKPTKPSPPTVPRPPVSARVSSKTSPPAPLPSSWTAAMRRHTDLHEIAAQLDEPLRLLANVRRLMLDDFEEEFRKEERGFRECKCSGKDEMSDVKKAKLMKGIKDEWMGDEDRGNEQEVRGDGVEKSSKAGTSKHSSEDDEIEKRKESWLDTQIEILEEMLDVWENHMNHETRGKELEGIVVGMVI